MTTLNILIAIAIIPLSISVLVPILQKTINLPPNLLFPLSTVLSLGIYSLIFSLVAFYGMNSAKAWLILALLWTTTIYFGQKPEKSSIFIYWSNLKSQSNNIIYVIAIVIIFLIITAQATYYPFTGDDEISRYAYFAKLLFENGYLLETIRGYPLMLPAIYASNFYMSGHIIEQVVKIYPVVIALMTVCATYGLALYWFNKKTAYISALILAATPLFIHWAPIGYVDIASGLCLTICAFSVAIWNKTPNLKWSLIIGMIVGICLWTKQSGFVAFIPLAIILSHKLISAYKLKQNRFLYQLITQSIIIICCSIIFGGWWYFRNIYYDGLELAIPNAGLYHIMQSNNDISHLIPFIGNYKHFGFVTSPIYILGLIWTIYKNKLHPNQTILIWCLPLTLLWWWQFSFDSRFLLNVLPFYAIMAGSTLNQITSKLQNLHNTLSYQIATRLLIIIIVIVGLIQARLGGIIQWVINPNASYAEKLYRSKGDLYPTVEYLLEHTNETDRIYSTDGRIRYYIKQPITIGYPSLSELLEYDIFVVGSRAQPVYDFISSNNSNTLTDLRNKAESQIIYTGPNRKISVYKINKDQ